MNYLTFVFLCMAIRQTRKDAVSSNEGSRKELRFHLTSLDSEAFQILIESVVTDDTKCLSSSVNTTQKQ